jgi:hypothetical protein
VERSRRRDARVAEDPRDDEKVLAGLERCRGREVPKVVPGYVRQARPGPSEVVEADDIPCVEWRADRRREDEAAVPPATSSTVSRATGTRPCNASKGNRLRRRGATSGKAAPTSAAEPWRGWSPIVGDYTGPVH